MTDELPAVPELPDVPDAEYGYLTTTGRSSGLPRTVEIWFAGHGRTAYMLADGRERTHWVANILAQPAVTFRIGDRDFAGRGRVVTDPDEAALAGELLVSKYQAGYAEDLSSWRVEALPVAIDLDLEPGADPDPDPDPAADRS
jgi:deazaflavin-dependent oxidoreductase (nitroreductase family)